MKQAGDWFSDRTKTWIVIITMTIMVAAIVGGYLSAKSWSEEQKLLRTKAEQTETLERTIEDDE